ncbi:MAG: plastocyanin/azurin family copper-binding protein [bacterium]
MNNRIALLCLLGLCAASFWSCTETNPMEPQTPGANEFWFQGGAVTPKSVSITSGTRIVWVNQDSESHSVDSGTFMNPTTDFSSPNLSSGQNFGFTFSTAGTFPFYCSRHQTRQSETGTVIVN